ncbi:MAG TPA: tRNA lysidine(34) synthetase TilS [Actinomycetota bacterium]
MPRPPAVARVLERVTATARRHEMFLPGQTVLVACSGGPDSVCLLYSLNYLRRLFKIKLEVFHLDHRMRSGSRGDAEYVRRVAERLRLPFHLAFAESKPAKGQSVEHWARSVRLVRMMEAMRSTGAARVAIGHTLDDQAETVLMAVLVGSGLEGVAGIAPAAGPFVQPLIEVSRADVEAFCRAIHLRPRHDPTNRDARFLRNAVRLEGLPALERALGRELRSPLARTGSLLLEGSRELARQASPAIAELVEDAELGVRVPALELLALPRAISARVVRQAILRCGGPPTREDVDAVLDLAAGRPRRRRDLSSGLKAARDKEYVSISRRSPESRDSGGT